MRRSLPAILLSVSGLALASALVLTACGADDASDHPMGAMPGGMDDHMRGGGPDPHRQSTPVAEGARRVDVRATSFAFDPATITVTAGEDVAIVLSSDDMVHDFTIDEIDVHVAADRGETAAGGLRAEEPGEYAYYCTVAGHREAGMEGTLVVEQP